MIIADARYAREGAGRSRRIIQLMPNRSGSCPNRVAKNVYIVILFPALVRCAQLLRDRDRRYALTGG